MSFPESQSTLIRLGYFLIFPLFAFLVFSFLAAKVCRRAHSVTPTPAAGSLRLEDVGSSVNRLRRGPTLEELRGKDAKVGIPLYVAPAGSEPPLDDHTRNNAVSLPAGQENYLRSSRQVRESLHNLFRRTQLS